VILDTGVLVGLSRRQLDLGELAGADDLALPAIALAEFLVGVELDPDERRSTVHREFIDAFRELAPVVDYTAEVAEHHAALLVHTRRGGRPRGALDLVIAACARATDRVLLTTDVRARFDDLPGVSVRVLTR
jgi:tRNA(fMet)-specific endonuclease VapC